MRSTPSLYLSHLSSLFVATLGLLALASGSPLEAQTCGTFTLQQNPYDGYSQVASSINQTFTAEFTLTDVKVGQNIIWYWTKNGTQIAGTGGNHTVNAPGTFNTTSNYPLVTASATVDHSGDYQLNVVSSCPAGPPCTCVTTVPFTSNIGVMRVDPTISVQPQPTAAQMGNNANFSVTATDGLGGVALVYDWFRLEPYQAPYEFLVGSTSGALTSNQAILLDQLSKTGNYYVRVRHNRGGSNPNRAVYGERDSNDARLAMNIPNAAAMGTNVCLTPNWLLGTNALYINPENFIGGFYQINQGGYFYLDINYNSSRYNGLGSCSTTSQPAGSYICYDSSRADNVKEYVIQAAAALVQSSYRYQKNGVDIAGSNGTMLDSNGFNYYSDNDAQQVDDGAYRLAMTSVPCGTNPGNSNQLPVDVIVAPITINAQYAYAYNNLGQSSNQINIPAQQPNTVVRGGMNMYVSASHPTESLSYQWEKFNTTTMAWANLPDDPTNNYYYGETNSSLNFYNDADGSSYPGIRYSDAGQYRLKITATGGAVVYSGTFNIGVYPQAPVSIQLPGQDPDPFITTAGSTIPLFSFVLPLEATSLNYTWQIRNLPSGNFTTFSNAAQPVITAVQGNYEIKVMISNTTVNLTTAQPVTSATITSNLMHLIVNPPAIIPPTIITPPTSQTIEDGQAAVFVVEASGSQPLSYQWQESINMGAFLNVGINSPVYSPIGVYNPSITSRRYQVIVSNGSGNATGGPANLTVNAAAPVITNQPASATVADGSFANFIVGLGGGTGPFTYQWQSCVSNCTAEPSWSNIGGATNINYLVQGNYNINNGLKYRVVVTGPSGLVAKSNGLATLTVTPVAPNITTQPLTQTVPDQTQVTLTVVANGTTPLTYQWQQSINLGGFTNISGATNAQYQFTAVYDQGITSRRYQVIIDNPAPGTLTSAIATITIQPPACSAPGVPTAIAPLPNAQNVSLLPTLSWQPVSANPNCTVTYDARVSLSAANNCGNPVSSGSTLGTIFSVSSLLNPQTTYYWCVRANANGTPGPWSSPINFMTTTAEVPAPTNLYTLPYTTPAFPAGNQQIILGAMNGEPMATGIFYLKQTGGDVIVGSTLIGSQPGGRFEVSIDVTAYGQATGPREYYARQQRFGTPTPGAASDSVIYYYDANLNQGLLPPPLQKNDPNTTGSLKWNAVPGAASYKVYRRVNLITTPLPAGQPLYAGTDGLGPKPYTLLPNVNPTPNGGFLTWTDTNLAADLAAASVTLSPDGVSYFVTAVSATNIESQRSNSQSFGDTIGPVRSQLHEGGVPTAPFVQRVFYIGTQTGRSAKGYMCNVNPMGYFHGPDYRENSADILAFVQVKLKPVSVSCAALSYDQGAQSYSIPFDSLRTVDISGFNDCLSIGEVGSETLIPNTDYCFKSCFKDTSANSEINCLEGTAGQTLPDGQAPDFAGVKEVTPEETGTSLFVEWEPPTYQQQILEPITYIVKATNNFAEGGEPIFEGDELITKEVESSELSTVLDNLKTGRTYCVRVAARDTAQNENGNNTTKCAANLNNRPFVDGLSISSDIDEAQKINIEFRIVDRTSDGVRLDRLAFKNSEVDNWVEVNSSSLSGNSDFLASADSLEAAPKHKVVFDSLPYFIGQRENFALQLTFVDSQGNETVVESEPTTAYYSNSRNASYSRSGRIGCSSSASSVVQGDLMILILCLMGIFGSLGLRTRRYRAFTGITK